LETALNDPLQPDYPGHRNATEQYFDASEGMVIGNNVADWYSPML
jgi:hypothetical protein